MTKTNTADTTSNVSTPMALPFTVFAKYFRYSISGLEEILENSEYPEWCEEHGYLPGDVADDRRTARTLLYIKQHLSGLLDGLCDVGAPFVAEREIWQKILYADIPPHELTQRAFFDAWEAINIPLLMRLHECFGTKRAGKIDLEMLEIGRVSLELKTLAAERLLRFAAGVAAHDDAFRGVVARSELERKLHDRRVESAFTECRRWYLEIHPSSDWFCTNFPHDPPLDWRPPPRGTPERNFWNAAKRLEIRMFEYGP